jgi:hypothetical protein
MGWRSEAAQLSARKCYDNHKAWQMLVTFFIGSMLELLFPYVQQCLHENRHPTPEDFVDRYCVEKSEKSPTFCLWFHMTFRYAMGIVNFRGGIHRNNAELVCAAKFMTRPLFHGRNHPKYQAIEIFEDFLTRCAPPEILTFLKNHVAISKSGHPSHGQGYDFLLEEENRSIKKWIHRGVATDDMWLGVIRNKDQFEAIYEAMNDIFEFDKRQSVSRNIDLTDAITEWRVCLREASIFSDSDFLSLSGEPLDYAMLKFDEESERKRSYRVLAQLLKQEVPDDVSLRHPVYVTAQEREKLNKIENLTISTLSNRIQELLQQIEDQDVREQYMGHFTKNVRKKEKRNPRCFLP